MQRALCIVEPLGGAGVAFRPKDLELAAELLGGLVYDNELRSAVIAGQRARLTDFAPARVAASLREKLEKIAS